jgi:hypothetical protein
MLILKSNTRPTLKKKTFAHLRPQFKLIFIKAKMIYDQNTSQDFVFSFPFFREITILGFP